MHSPRTVCLAPHGSQAHQTEARGASGRMKPKHNDERQGNAAVCHLQAGLDSTAVASRVKAALEGAGGRWRALEGCGLGNGSWIP
jgi:hypothetical protein